MTLLNKLKADCHDCKFSQNREEGYICRNPDVDNEPFCVIYNPKGQCQFYKRTWWKLTKPRKIK